MSGRILFVDDEPISLQGYHRLLRKDFQISTAVGGAAALLLVKQEGPFGVIVADMRMPVMSGIDRLDDRSSI
jgi:CheY-like chemotaxis protein